MTEDDNLLPIRRALAESKRRQILELLEQRPHTTSELCQYFDVSRFAVMKHLNVLEQAELITFRREGRLRWNILNDDLVQFLRTIAIGQERFPYELSEVLGYFPASERFNFGATTRANTVCIESDVLLHSSRDHVFRALTAGINQWWCHRASIASLGVYLEPIINGRFYEAFDSAGQGELFATVTYARKSEEIRFQGSMGVINTTALSQVRIVLEERNEGTLLQVVHRMIGEVDSHLIDHFGHYWDEALSRSLKAFVEEGVTYQALHHQTNQPVAAVGDDCQPEVSIVPN